MESPAPTVATTTRVATRRRVVSATIAAGGLATSWLGITAWERGQDQRTREQMEAVAAAFEKDGFTNVSVRRDPSIGPFHARSFVASMQGDVARISAETADTAASSDRLIAFLVRGDGDLMFPDIQTPKGFIVTGEAGTYHFQRPAR